MLLKAQRFLGTADGIVEDFSMWPNVKPGANYWVKPIKGRIKKRMIVLAIAKRSWMGRNKRLIRNYIVKRVKEVKVRCFFYFVLILIYATAKFFVFISSLFFLRRVMAGLIYVVTMLQSVLIVEMKRLDCFIPTV